MPLVVGVSAAKTSKPSKHKENQASDTFVSGDLYIIEDQTQPDLRHNRFEAIKLAVRLSNIGTFCTWICRDDHGEKAEDFR